MRRCKRLVLPFWQVAVAAVVLGACSGSTEQFESDGQRSFAEQWLEAAQASVENFTSLDLFDSGLGGTLPTEIGQLTALTYVDLVQSGLTSTLPSELGIGLGRLETFFRAQSNHFTGMIPTEVGKMSQMRRYWYANDNSLVGPVPTEIGLLTGFEKGFKVQSNSLSRSLPTELGMWSRADCCLAFQSNRLTGLIPTEIGLLTGLTQGLELGWNSFSGTLPTELGQLTRLKSRLVLDQVGAAVRPLPTELGRLSLLDHSCYLGESALGFPSEVGHLTGIAHLETSARKSENAGQQSLLGLHMDVCEVRDAGAKGRGVYATVDMEPGTLVHEAPAIVIPEDEFQQHLEHTVLSQYGFEAGRDAMLALGIGSLFNHARNPNLSVFIDKKAAMFRFIACREIHAGDELRITYGDDEDMWFPMPPPGEDDRDDGECDWNEEFGAGAGLYRARRRQRRP